MRFGILLGVLFLVASLPPAGVAGTAHTQVTTYHNDNARTAVNASEKQLTPGGVNVSTFGRLYTLPVDGFVYAQPLYLSNVSIPNQGTHNILFVATQHDSVYAFDVGGIPTVLWQVSFLNPIAGVTTVSSGEVGTDDIVPEIGITGTPVIDPASGTLYVVAKTHEQRGPAVVYVQRLHALDVRTGHEKFGGPVEITASVPGSGDGNDGTGNVPFNPLRENQRPGLLLLKGVVYIGWASHGDNDPYHGWLIGYNAKTLKQVGVYNVTPNGSRAGFWQAGAAPAADSAGNIYFSTGNGTFDANRGGPDLGDSILRLKTHPSLSLADYFTPFDQAFLEAVDLDLGSGGVLVLPNQPGAHPHLLVQSGKEGTIYLVNRDHMGGFSADGNRVVLELVNALRGGVWGAPAFFNRSIYYGGVNDGVKSFSLTPGLTANADFSTGFTSASGLTLNGSAAIAAPRLRLTDGGFGEAGSAFATHPVNVAHFTTQFDFQLADGTTPSADGITFTIQGGGPFALGQGGGDLGSGGLPQSVSIKFDLYDNAGEGINSTGIFLNGAHPYVPATDLTPSGIDLHSGHVFRVTMSYDGVVLHVTLKDTTTSVTANQAYPVNIRAVLGSSAGFAGFTGGTGGLSAVQDILNWRYTAAPVPATVLALGSQSTSTFGYPGAGIGISANGAANGILWAIQSDGYGSGDPAVLHAYDATNLAAELYNSAMLPARDAARAAVKFSVPTVADGRVYVAGQDGVTVYGFLAHP